MGKGGLVPDNKFIQSPGLLIREDMQVLGEVLRGTGGEEREASKLPYGTDVLEPMNLRFNFGMGHHDN